MFNLIIKKKQTIYNDILSGLTVAIALVPEAIAFSFVCYVDPTVGLYAAFMMGIITAIFGGRPGMISGATGAVAVIFAPLVLEQTKLNGLQAGLDHLFLAVIIMGLLQLLFGLFKLGKFVRLIPQPVMLGFVNGLAIVIFKAQLAQFYIGTGEQARLMEPVALSVMCALIVMTMLMCQFLPKVTKKVPATLAAIVTVTGLSFILKQAGFDIYTVLDFVQNLDPSKSTIAANLPHFRLPPITFEKISYVLPYSVLAALVGLIESLMTLTLIDELTETRGRSNKESIGQGIANVINGCFGGMGGCAMIGQSMINVRAGGRGRLSGISAAMFLLFFFLFGAQLIEQIPLAALVGVMFMVCIATFEWSSFRIITKIEKSDAFVIVLVSVVTVLADLAIAVLLGVIVSALVFAWKQSQTIQCHTEEKDKQKAYFLKGPLFFGSVQNFKDLFDVKNDPNEIFINFKLARVYDHSGIDAINSVAERYKALNKVLHLVNVSKECKLLLKKSENIVEIKTIEGLDWHIASNQLA